MSIKIIDSDCAINLFERMKSFDSVPFFSNYETMMTENVLNELRDGNSFREMPFKTYTLSVEEQTLFDDMTNYMSKLGKGERSTMVHALFLSNKHSCEGSDKVIVLSNDKQASHIFHKELPKNPMMRELFPNIDKIIWVKTVDVIEKIWNEGFIDNDAANGIYDELHVIIGPKLEFLIQ